MIRCRCGTWTEYGITCVKCRQDVYKTLVPAPVREVSEVKKARIEDDDEPEEIEEEEEVLEWFDENDQ